MIAATAGTSCAPLVRVTANEPTHVKRALDLGAEGIMFPLIDSVQDARDAIASLRYPPEGTRGFGPFIAQSRWGTQMTTYRATVQDHLVCCLLIETRGAVEAIEEICALPGVDIIVPAQFDLSTALGVSGQSGHPDLVAAVTRIERAALDTALPLGGVALTPLGESGGAAGLEMSSFREAAILIEVVGDGRMHGDELLQTSHAAEA